MHAQSSFQLADFVGRADLKLTSLLRSHTMGQTFSERTHQEKHPQLGTQKELASHPF